MRCASQRGPLSLASILLLLSTVLSFAQGNQATAQVPIQRVVASPYPALSHLETGYAVLEYTAGRLLIGGTAIAASDDSPLASAGFLARIDSDNNVLEWSEYGAAESIFPAAINVLVDLPDSGLIAGGVSADTGYLLRLNAEGGTLWSAALDSAGIESVVSIEPLPRGGFLVFGESTFDSAIEGSGAYVAVPVDDEGTVGTPTRYGAAQQERIVQVVRVRGGTFQAYSNATSEPGAAPELWVRGVDATGTFLWEKSLGVEPDYPVAGVHLTLDPNVILIRPRVIDGVFDESCRLQYVDQEGNRYRTRDLLVDIYGTHLVGTIRFTDNRFGIVAYDREAVHVVVCDYRTGFLDRVSVPVDQALAADLGAPGAAAARPEIYGMTLRDNGNLVLVGALVTEPETPVDESGDPTDLYTVEINAESLYLDFSDIIGIAARDLRANFDDAETSGNALLSFAEATAPSLAYQYIVFRNGPRRGQHALVRGTRKCCGLRLEVQPRRRGRLRHGRTTHRRRLGPRLSYARPPVVLELAGKPSATCCVSNATIT